MEKSGKRVSVTMPQETYEALSVYAKQCGLSVRSMHQTLITEAVKRDLWHEMMQSSAIKLRVDGDDLQEQIDELRKTILTMSGNVDTDTYDEIVSDFEKKEDEEHRRHCYTGMVADYHREIAPVVDVVVNEIQEPTESDLDDILGEDF